MYPKLCTLNSVPWIVHNPYTVQWTTRTLYNAQPVHCTMHNPYTVRCTIRTLYSSQHVHCTMHNPYNAQHVHCIVHNPYTVQCTSRTFYSAQPVHCTMHNPYIVQCTTCTLYSFTIRAPFTKLASPHSKSCMIRAVPTCTIKSYCPVWTNQCSIDPARSFYATFA